MLDETKLAKLAREIAMNIRPRDAILQDYGLNEQTFEKIDANPFFTRAREQFALEWNSALSVNDRVKLTSASYLEEALPRLAARMMADEPLAAVNEIAKLFSRNAGLGEPKPEGRNNERFVIQINLGGEVETFDKPLEIVANEEVDDVAKLSAAERKRLPASSFALPGKGEGKSGKGSGSYPVPDKSHARNALARVAQHGTAAEKAKVRAKVKAKFPAIGKKNARGK